VGRWEEGGGETQETNHRGDEEDMRFNQPARLVT